MTGWPCRSTGFICVDIKRQALTLMSSLGGIDCHCWKNRGRNKKEARVTS